MKRKRVSLYSCLLLWVLLLSALSGCKQVRETEVRRLIGVSLANQTDEWRVELKKELQAEAAQYEGLKLIFLDAGGDVEKQKSDLKELMAYGAELLIVSPVDVEALISSVEQIYREGMPILLLDRAVKGFDYTCFLGADDRLLAEKEASAIPLLTGKGEAEEIRVVNILIDSYTGRQRASLLNEAVSGNIDIKQLIIPNGTRDETEDILLERTDLLKGADLILTQNDYMARGAANALKILAERDGSSAEKEERIKILGVDGFFGADGGIEMVKEGIIDATIMCPAGGREAISYAVNYFEGMNDGPKQIIVRNSLVTPETAEELLSAPAEKKQREISAVGYVQIDEDTGFRRANTESYRNAAREYGIGLEIRECKTVEEQLAAFEEFLAAEKDVIILSPIVEDGWEEVFQKAGEKDIPVILSDREVSLSDELYTVFVGADFVEEGARCMRWVEENVTGKEDVKILELAGTRGSSPANGRGRGFREMMKGKPAYRIIDSLNGDFSREEGYQAMKDYLEKNGSAFDVLYCHNDDMMLGAVKAMKEAGLKPGEEICVLSVDGTMEALTALQNGEVNFVAECTPLLGRDTMRVIEMLQKGEELPLKVISTEGSFDRNTPDTVFRGRKY